jgi:A/G-specific adenine glycosylase
MAPRHRVKRQEISLLLIDWYARGHRDFPWRRTSDPYRVWVSEIMLQQTRAQAVVPYFERFLERFPTVEALAAAQEEEALALWSGLGYYSRARNLLRAARLVHAAGAFPADYAGLRALPGVGDYTAAAVASIAFGLPHAVLDGNVMRVVSRMRNDAAETGSARTRERFRAIAQEWLDPLRPGAFNQALMELGATVCLPRNPLCPVCPLQSRCAARAEGTAANLPVKLRKTEPRHIEAVLLVVRKGRRVLLRREAKSASRMAGFWGLPAPEHLPRARLGACLGEFRHTITCHHYTLSVHVARARGRGPGAGGKTGARGQGPGAGELTLASLARGVANKAAEFQWFDPSEFDGIPLSTTARKALRLAGIA